MREFDSLVFICRSDVEWFEIVHQAKLIEFQPLRATDIRLPDGAVFVISNCCVEMNKAASSHYNVRVVECRIATKVQWWQLEVPLLLTIESLKLFKCLICRDIFFFFWPCALGFKHTLFKGHIVSWKVCDMPSALLQKYLFASQMLAQARGLDPSGFMKLVQAQTELKASLEEMMALVDEVLHPEPYTREEICRILCITPEQFATDVLSANTQNGNIASLFWIWLKSKNLCVLPVSHFVKFPHSSSQISDTNRILNWWPTSVVCHYVRCLMEYWWRNIWYLKWIYLHYIKLYLFDWHQPTHSIMTWK